MPTYDNHQIGAALFMRTHNDLSNYNAATITLRKRPSHGLQFDMNYTFSKSLDQVGTVQNNAGHLCHQLHPRLSVRAVALRPYPHFQRHL